MSEYQYYEFKTIDAPLTQTQKDYLHSLSSRARVTNHSASFVYHYGDFRGDVYELMSDYFDAMIYMANWGTKQLIFRIPSELIDIEQVSEYCTSEELAVYETSNKKYLLIELLINDEDDEEGYNCEEIEDLEGSLDDLSGIREELIRGDFRALYLMWMKTADFSDPEEFEPTVPPGLSKLSIPQEKLVEFLEIDRDQIEVAAEKSPKLPNPVNLEPYIDRLSSSEQREFLLRLIRGESNLSKLLNRRLLYLAQEEVPEQIQTDNSNRRTMAFIYETAEKRREKREQEEREKKEKEKQQRLRKLASRKDQAWVEVEQLILEKRNNSYDAAVALLIDLRDLAEQEGAVKEFEENIRYIKKKFVNRTALADALRRRGLI